MSLFFNESLYLNLLFQITIIIVISLLLRFTSKKTLIPLPLMLILSGSILAYFNVLKIDDFGSLTELIRMTAIILIVFASAFSLKKKEIENETAFKLATLGVLITALVIAVSTYFFLGISLIVAVILGVLLSGTDPAIVSLIREKTRIKNILLTEAIFNQPLTIILPLIIIDFITTKNFSFFILPLYFIKFLLLFAVGVIIGFIVSKFTLKILEFTEKKYYEISLISMALLSYTLSELLLGSGILTVAVYSFLIARNIKEKEMLGEFNENIALFFTFLVFFFLGMQFNLQDFFSSIITRNEIIVIIISLVVARALSVFSVSFKSNLTLREKIMLTSISPKGISPAALAPLFLGIIAVSEAGIILRIVYITIIISIIISFISLLTGKKEKTVKERLLEKKQLKPKLLED